MTLKSYLPLKMKYFFKGNAPQKSTKRSPFKIKCLHYHSVLMLALINSDPFQNQVFSQHFNCFKERGLEISLGYFPFIILSLKVLVHFYVASHFLKNPAAFLAQSIFCCIQMLNDKFIQFFYYFKNKNLGTSYQITFNLQMTKKKVCFCDSKRLTQEKKSAL